MRPGSLSIETWDSPCAGSASSTYVAANSRRPMRLSRSGSAVMARSATTGQMRCPSMYFTRPSVGARCRWPAGFEAIWPASQRSGCCQPRPGRPGSTSPSALRRCSPIIAPVGRILAARCGLSSCSSCGAVAQALSCERGTARSHGIPVARRRASFDARRCVLTATTRPHRHPIGLRGCYRPDPGGERNARISDASSPRRTVQGADQRRVERAMSDEHEWLDAALLPAWPRVDCERGTR